MPSSVVQTIVLNSASSSEILACKRSSSGVDESDAVGAGSDLANDCIGTDSSWSVLAALAFSWAWRIWFSSVALIDWSSSTR